LATVKQLNRKFKYAAPVVFLAIGAALLAFFCFSSHEPKYKGKTLSAWLALGNGGRVEYREPAREAVVQIGTNAVPALLRMLREKDSLLTKAISKISQKFRWLPEPTLAEDVHLNAGLGFCILTNQAVSAIPALIAIYHENVSESSQDAAFASLEAIGWTAVSKPVLYEGLTNRYGSIRMRAMWELTPTNTPDVSVPILIQSLNDPVPSVQWSAAGKLRRFGTNALPAVPALVRLANTPGLLNHPAKLTLCVIDPKTAEKLMTNWGFNPLQPRTNDVIRRK
jgi:hypothetical protein